MDEQKGDWILLGSYCSKETATPFIFDYYVEPAAKEEFCSFEHDIKQIVAQFCLHVLFHMYVSALQTPTIFLVPVRGFFPSYFKDLYDRLPSIKKRLVEINGGVFWMLSPPNQAAKIVCDWFDESLC